MMHIITFGGRELCESLIITGEEKKNFNNALNKTIYMKNKHHEVEQIIHSKQFVN